MILLDAANIKVGGGKVLLEYLLKVLEQKRFPTLVIWKADLFEYQQTNFRHILFINGAGPGNRKKIFKHVLEKYSISVVLCFGNYPPPVRPECKVYTYFHNPYLLDLPFIHFKKDPLIFFRNFYLKWYIGHTDYFVVQSEMMKRKLLKKFPQFTSKQCFIWPIFDTAGIQSYRTATIKENRFIYVSYPYAHKNHRILLQAWHLLAQRKLYPPLVLTVPENQHNGPLLSLISDIRSEGGFVENLGAISHQQALLETERSRYVIFPSINETFGLGLIEGVLLGSAILAPNLPYVREVIRPSATFDPNDVNSVADCVANSFNAQNITESHLLVHDCVADLIHSLNQYVA